MGPALLVAALVGAVPLGAQQGCEFIEGSGNLQTVDIGTGPITYVSTPNLSCRDGVRIRADSAVAFQASNYVQLIGHVRFEDPERRLTAQNAEYFTTVGRLQAHQGAELVQKTDSTRVRGSEMIYNRADRDRARAQLEVYGDRPTARLYPRPSVDSAAVPADSAAAAAVADSTPSPYDIEADHLLIEADSYFRARGDVEITRADLRAYADSVEYDQVAGTLRLTSRARMRIDERDLSAEVITVDLPGDEVREVEARRKAIVTSQDIRLQAPLVRVFFAAGVMERLVAVPLAPTGPAAAVPTPAAVLAPPGPVLTDEDRARPVATAESFTIVADSLDVLAPAEVLDRIHAVGGARAESTARDSLNTPATPKLARTDWMEGDTIVAIFARVPRADSAAAPDRGGLGADSARSDFQIERLSAIGKARTLYRIEPSDSARARGDRNPAIHYVTAASIVLDCKGGEIRSMEVHGQTEGVHADPTPTRVDSAGVRPDSAGARADTTRAGLPRGGGGPPKLGGASEPAGPRTATAPSPVLPLRRSRPRRRLA
ncbi:MAG: hypothetical protein EXR95_02030 [Gemmatimonadetes bacterium]|nr:hypothetical protein [Gemmatimonadota bacterium]